MICKVCKTKMICKNSREENNIRWRQYDCPKCASIIFTREQAVHGSVCRARIRDISTLQKKISTCKDEIPLLRSPY